VAGIASFLAKILVYTLFPGSKSHDILKQFFTRYVVCVCVHFYSLWHL
jgi:hypothetical protein